MECWVSSVLMKSRNPLGALPSRPRPLCSLFRLVPLLSISFSIGWLVVLLTRDSFLWLCNTAGWLLLTADCPNHHEAGVFGPLWTCRGWLLGRVRRRAQAAPGPLRIRGSDPNHVRLCAPLGNFSAKRQRVRIRSLPALLPIVEARQWVLPYVPIVNLVRPRVVTVLSRQSILTFPPITGVVADGKIYVDGGETYVPKNNGNFNTTPEGNFTKGISSCSLCPPPPRCLLTLLEITISSSLTSPKTSPPPTRPRTLASSKAPRSPRR
jgi:hypothetical protein